MSPRLPSVRPRDVIRVLERDGWQQVGQRGSHLKLHKDGHRRVIVPIHNRDMRPGTLRAILEDAEMSEERFLELLRS